MARLVPLLTHLVPPSGVSGLRLDRFSPGFDDAERLGFLDVAPFPSYAAVYPLSPEAVSNLAYSFSFRARGGGRARATTSRRSSARSRAGGVRRGRASSSASRPATRSSCGTSVPSRAGPSSSCGVSPRVLHAACDASANARALADAGRAACGATREEVGRGARGARRGSTPPARRGEAPRARRSARTLLSRGSRARTILATSLARSGERRVTESPFPFTMTRWRLVHDARTTTRTRWSGDGRDARLTRSRSTASP